MSGEQVPAPSEQIQSWLDRIVGGIAGCSPYGSGELFVADGGRRAKPLAGTSLRQRLRATLMWNALRVAQKSGFPFKSLTISAHSPAMHDDRGGATSIELKWRNRVYKGFLTDDDPRDMVPAKPFVAFLIADGWLRSDVDQLMTRWAQSQREGWYS